MNKHLTLFIFFSLLCLSYDVKAQQDNLITVRDFESWLSANLKYKVTDKTSIRLEQQLRLKDNSSQADQYFTEINIRKQINKSFYYGVGLRYIRDNKQTVDIPIYENHFRYNIDLGYKHRMNKFTLKYRLRFQRKNELGITIGQGDEPRNYLRARVGARLNIKKWKLDPELSSEIFYNLNRGEHFNKVRFTLGSKYKFNTFGSLGAFYRIEKELAAFYPQTWHILGVQYAYTLKRKTKDD